MGISLLLHFANVHRIGLRAPPAQGTPASLQSSSVPTAVESLVRTVRHNNAVVVARAIGIAGSHFPAYILRSEKRPNKNPAEYR